jgi:hypothetical protein
MNILIRRRLMGLIFATFVSLAMGCTNSKTRSRGGEEVVSSTSNTSPVPTSTTATSREAAPSCGREVQMHGQGINDAARTCLWDAYQAGGAAELVITRHTIEGDPITTTIRVRSKSSIEVIDDSQDRFGSRGVRNAMCSEMERSPEVNGHRGFTIRGCRGSMETVEVR